MDPVLHAISNSQCPVPPASGETGLLESSSPGPEGAPRFAPFGMLGPQGVRLHPPPPHPAPLGHPKDLSKEGCILF